MSTVVVTRPQGMEDPLVPRLEALGHRVVAVATVGLEPAAAGGPLDRSLAGLGAGAWIVVTSPMGANAVLGALARVRPADPLATWHWAAVGEATATCLGKGGVVPEIVPSRAGGPELAMALLADGRLAGGHALLARSDAADPGLPAALRRSGAHVEEVIAYRTLEGPASARAPMAAALGDPTLTAIVFASGSAVRGAIAVASPAARARLAELPAVSIGPATSAVVRRLGLRLAAEARSASIDGLVAAVEHAVRTTRPLVSHPVETQQ